MHRLARVRIVAALGQEVRRGHQVLSQCTEMGQGELYAVSRCVSRREGGKIGLGTAVGRMCTHMWEFADG